MASTTAATVRGCRAAPAARSSAVAASAAPTLCERAMASAMAFSLTDSGTVSSTPAQDGRDRRPHVRRAARVERAEVEHGGRNACKRVIPLGNRQEGDAVAPASCRMLASWIWKLAPRSPRLPRRTNDKFDGGANKIDVSDPWRNWAHGEQLDARLADFRDYRYRGRLNFKHTCSNLREVACLIEEKCLRSFTRYGAKARKCRPSRVLERTLQNKQETLKQSLRRAWGLRGTC
jgi:hypothetical protein